ncbi:SHOCT domain-containing protein [Rhodococcus kronopolitis]|uniref:SHOCT domain-containing protein n=1 Tax=Rhodococcus kronopolitis TaxID=1460226 RepID=A0ABV9FL29_9NOCA
MPLGRGRVGRPGLLGTMARTAVITGTAKATSNAMNRSSQRRGAEQQAYADQQAAAQQQAYADQQAAAQQQAFAAQQAAAQQAAAQQAQAAPADDLISKLQQLGTLHENGVLSDQEFAAAKAKLLG